jgi:hypothetical protein
MLLHLLSFVSLIQNINLPFISTSLHLLPLSLATASTAGAASYFLSQWRSSSLFLLTPPRHHEPARRLSALSSSLGVYTKINFMNEYIDTD